VKEPGVIYEKPSSRATWRKSTASGNSGCVEITDTAEHVWVRDTKDRQGPVLAFTRDEWTAFLAGVRAGEFDGPVV
jgi:Domain of unknown function (DUF397)